MKVKIAWLCIAWAFFVGLVGVPTLGNVLGIGAALLLMIVGTALYL